MSTSRTLTATASLESYIKNFEIKTKSSKQCRKSKRIVLSALPSNRDEEKEEPKQLKSNALDQQTDLLNSNLSGFDIDLIKANLNHPIDQIEKLIKNLSFRINEFRLEMNVINPKNRVKKFEEQETINNNLILPPTKDNEDKISIVKFKEDERDPLVESLNKFKELNKFLTESIGKKNSN